jgi:hypothetical protein
MPEANLGVSLGASCAAGGTAPTGTIASYYDDNTDPQATVRLANAGATWPGFIMLKLANGQRMRFTFRIICLQSVLVVAPEHAVRVVDAVERWMTIPVPWTVPAGRARAAGVRFAWCADSWSCLNRERDGDGLQTGRYPDNFSARGLCLPMYDRTQRVASGGGYTRVNAFPKAQGAAAWRTFWLAVGDAIARYNAGEPALR